jgi:hypothetical protein
LIVIDRGGTHDGVAVKMNKEMAPSRYWQAGGSAPVGEPTSLLTVAPPRVVTFFVSEFDVDTAGAALTKLGQ